MYTSHKMSHTILGMDGVLTWLKIKQQMLLTKEICQIQRILQAMQITVRILLTALILQMHLTKQSMLLTQSSVNK